VVLVGVSHRLGDNTNDNLTLPGTGSQNATDALSKSFPDQANGTSPIVLHVSNGKLTDSKYADAVNIDKLILRNGSSDNYSATNRVEQMHLVFVETGQTADVNVQDSPDPKTYTVKNGHGSARRPLHTIQIFITKQYPALQGVNQVAITELTFFQKK